MKRRTKRAEQHARIKAAKQAGMKNPGGASNYALKKRWLDRNGMWGFDVSSPKPWKASK